MKPILSFPRATLGKKLKQKTVIPPKLQTPARGGQYQRLFPIFKKITESFSTSQAQVSASHEGMQVERMLVIETAGAIANFYKAASKVPGLDLILEIESEKIDADNDFHFLGKERNKQVSTFLYMSMTNQSALDYLLRHWKAYSENVNFKWKRGYTPLRELFLQIRTIRYWDTEDRLRDTGIIENWKFRLEYQAADIVPAEIELWYRKDPGDRNKAQASLEKLIREQGGAVVSQCTIPEISYHAVLVNLPAQAAWAILNSQYDNVALIKFNGIMQLRPVGQCQTGSTEVEELDIVEPRSNSEQFSDEPIVALLDGMPLIKHEAIRDALIIDDPDDFSSQYKASQQVHGTAMASLIIHGDYEENNRPLDTKIYVRPIQTPIDENNNGEHLPEHILPVDLTHRAVKRIFEGDGNEPASAPTVRIINLSIGDDLRLFDREMSPWARLIDWLSYKYQVLFVVSAGNHTEILDLEMPTSEYNQLTSKELESIIVNKLYSQSASKRLKAPAEAINALSVGSLHQDASAAPLGLVDLLTTPGMPALYNPISWGRARSIKPEVLMPGGRLFYQNNSFLDSQNTVLEPHTSSPKGGLKTAHPGLQGQLNGFAYSCGTSNSAALTSRRLCLLHSTLKDLTLSDNFNLDRNHEAALLKALLVHGAESKESSQHIKEILDLSGNSTKAKIAALIGYGGINEDRIHGCIDNQATIIQTGTIGSEETYKYKLPLPNSLSGKAVHRRLIITLAWLSPVNAKHQTYKQADIFFRPAAVSSKENILQTTERESDHNMVRKGTVQHEVFIGENAAAYNDGASIDITVECIARAGATKKSFSIPYGLVVTIDTKDESIPIYEEVKTSLEVQHKVAGKIR